MTRHEDDMASVRYVVDDVQAAIDFYTTHLGFILRGPTLWFQPVPEKRTGETRSHSA